MQSCALLPLVSSSASEYGGQIGQQANDPRSTTGTDPQNVASSLPLPKLFVVPLGGEYFLSPSISALKGTLVSA
jgi:hypothetical protein